MALKHNFTSAIADDSVAAAAGEVVPSDWNANHKADTANAFIVSDSTSHMTEMTVGAAITALGVDLKENLSNKATDFSTVNNTLYPSTKAAQENAIAMALIFG